MPENGQAQGSGVRRREDIKQSAGPSTGAHGIFCHGAAIAPRDLKFHRDILLEASYQRAIYGVDAIRRRGRADPRMISGTTQIYILPIAHINASYISVIFTLKCPQML